MFRMTRAMTALVSTAVLSLAACGETTPPIVNPPVTKPKPTVKVFRAEPTTVARGAKAQLVYEVTDATALTFSTDAGQFATSTMLMGMVETPAITADTTFILSATGAGGTTTQRVTVTIDASAVSVVSFMATPNPVAVGGMVTLAWNTAGAKSIRLLRDGAEILANSGDRVASGSETVTIDRGPVRFELIAANEAGMMDSETINVTTAEPVVLRAFTVRPQVFTGASAMISISWTTTNATEIALTANGTAVPNFPGNTGTGTVTVEVSAQTRFELTVRGLGGPLVATEVVTRGVAEMEPNDTPMTATMLTDGGAQGEITAADVDNYSVTVAEGGNLFVQVTDGMGGCGFDSKVRVLDAAGDVVAENDDSSGSLCPLLDPRFDAEVAQLPAGIYTIEVTGFDETETGTYALVVVVGQAGCGNSIIEESRMEQCDDGNMATMDGCDAACRFEIRGTVNQGGDMSFTGALPENGLAVYTVVLTGDGYVSVENFSPMAGVCTNVDLFAAILDDTGAVLASDDNDGIDGCAFINPVTDVGARLGAGTYTVVMGTVDGTALPAYAVRIRSFGMGCGNGISEMGERCDDGNTMAGDGCSATCTLEFAGTISGGAATSTFTGALPAGRSLTYELRLTSPAYIYAATGVPTIGMCGMMDSDTLLVLTSSSGREIARNDDIDETLCSRIDTGAGARPVLLQPATYALTVRPFLASGTVPALQTLVRLTVPACGNNIVEANESCDDGNTRADGNGCTATCSFDMSIIVESEPNETTMQADALGNVRTSTMVATGGIGTMGTDVDLYVFDVTGAAAALTARTFGSLTDRTLCGGDTELALLNAQGTVLVSNDDGGPGTCSEISMTATGTAAATLAAGRYFLRVSEYRSDSEIPRYFLEARIR